MNTDINKCPHDALCSMIAENCSDETSNLQILRTGKGNICAIYFSSNGIFFPNTPESFEETIIKKDRYEWKKNLIKKASLHIFVRDLKKSWYLYGINDKYNDVPSLAEYLKNLTAGYEIITLGSSAGGFAAVLFGTLLNANRIYCFSGQFNIEKENDPSYSYFLKIINSPYSKPYLNLIPLIKNSLVPIYYFYPNASEYDLGQEQLVKTCRNVKKFAIQSADHGVAVSYKSLNFIINAPPEILDREFCTQKEFSTDYFFLKYSSCLSVIFYYLKKFIKNTVIRKTRNILSKEK